MHPRFEGVAVDNAQHLRTESYHFFLNDQVRLTPRLTLSAGLRYEYNSPPVDAEDRANVYDTTTRSAYALVHPETPLHFEYSTMSGIPSA